VESGGRFCVGEFGRNLGSVTVKMFSHLIHLFKKCYKCSLSGICKCGAAINCVAFEQKFQSHQL
jgi:hypothetical protein